MNLSSDLTVIYLTANQHPDSFAQYQRQVLLEAIGDLPLIVVSRKPISFIRGTLTQHILDDAPKSHLNMYKQLVEAAKLATTPYIAVAEDDALYPAAHFTEFRPKLDEVAYDRHRWSLYTWTGLYSVKDRISNCTLIAGREYYIDAWEERFRKYPEDSMPAHRVGEIGRHNLEGWMGVSERKQVDFWASRPTIHVNHVNGTDSVGQKKKMGIFRASDIPYWGKAEDLIARYK